MFVCYNSMDSFDYVPIYLIILLFYIYVCQLYSEKHIILLTKKNEIRDKTIIMDFNIWRKK